MIDEKWLDENEKRASLCEQATFPGEQVRELIQLAKMGLWARDVGVPALKKYRYEPDWADHDEYREPGQIAREAIRALPKEER